MSARRSVGVLLLLLLSVLLTPPVSAASGNVLPPTAKPKGYSLLDAAKATAEFNVNLPRSADTLPNVPFQILYEGQEGPSFPVAPGTMLYVPVVYDVSTGSSAPVDLNDARDLFFNRERYGAEYIQIVVDGKVTSLGPEYLVLVVKPLSTSNGDYDHYTVAAVFLTPLSKGTHTVTIGSRFTGEAIGGVLELGTSYTVVVA